MSDFIFPDILRPEVQPQIWIANPQICFYCGSAPLSTAATHCPVCGFPQHGTEAQQMAFIEEKREKVKAHEKLEIVIGWAQTVLLFTGLTAIVIAVGSYFLWSGYNGWNGPWVQAFLYIIVAAVPNIGLWLWSKKQPFPAIAIALGLTVAGLLVQIFKGGFSLSAMLLPLLLILVFSHALISYRDAVKIEEELIVKPRDLRN